MGEEEQRRKDLGEKRQCMESVKEGCRRMEDEDVRYAITRATDDESSSASIKISEHDARKYCIPRKWISVRIRALSKSNRTHKVKFAGKSRMIQWHRAKLHASARPSARYSAVLVHRVFLRCHVG
ncbi:hypothetical protein BD410DRAFT_797364 [Rickenella mellea]|uniref:Uncharacterized protein n=1 Tax=Rickenella mellea TaxID=50990 RepID=A0A4Y7PGS6_9AGAM|nr:hypothetical protein BD410DRAFT_797364 [Rickenella mellea]